MARTASSCSGQHTGTRQDTISYQECERTVQEKTPSSHVDICALAGNVTAEAIRSADSPRVALLVVTVGRHHELGRLLESLTQQTAKNFFLYIGDQNTTNDAQELISRYATTLKIHRISFPRQALSKIRNGLMDACLKEEHPDWIGFPDDDCWFETDTLQMLSAYSARHPEVDGIVCSSKNEHGVPRGATEAPLHRYNAISASETWVQFYRTRAVERIGTFDERLGPGTGLPYGCGEDTDYLLRALQAGLCIRRYPEMVMRHPGPKLSDRTLKDKWRAYGHGRMFLLAKHGFPLWFMLLNVAYPLCRLLRNGPSAWEYSKQSFLGRLQGLQAYIQGRMPLPKRGQDALMRLIGRLYPRHVSPRDEELLRCIFAERLTQSLLDDCLKRCDIEALGGTKCLLLSYLMHEHPDLSFSAYTGPRVRGLLNFWRFRNLRTLAHFSRIGKALGAAGIPMLLFKGGAMKFLRPELSRVMGDVDILVPKDRLNEAVKISTELGYECDRANSLHAVGMHTATEDAVDIHYALFDPGTTDLRALHAQLFDRATRRNAFGVDVLLPCHEDLFFLVLANFTKNLRAHTSLNGLYFALCDCHFLMNDKPDFDWEIVRSDARKSGKELEICFAAWFMNAIIPGTIPLDKLNMPITSQMEAFCNQVVFDEEIYLRRQQTCQAIRVVDLKNHPVQEGRPIATFLLLKQIRKHPLFVKLYFTFRERRMKDGHY